MFTLLVCNPVTLVRLYGRYKRNKDMKRASVVLMELTRTLTRGHCSVEPSTATMLSKDAKIFIQIIGVTIIFFLYMFIYYLFFHVMEMTGKWSAMLNSFLYTVCHMVNPVVYFSLNEQMQEQLTKMLRSCVMIGTKKVIKSAEADPLLSRNSTRHDKSSTTTTITGVGKECNHLLDTTEIEDSSAANCSLLNTPKCDSNTESAFF